MISSIRLYLVEKLIKQISNNKSNWEKSFQKSFVLLLNNKYMYISRTEQRLYLISLPTE